MTPSVTKALLNDALPPPTTTPPEPENEPYPVEEVAVVVPETDDPSLPVMTFRAWVLGPLACALLMCVNTFFAFRTQPLNISPILMQILVVPAGRFMAWALPKKEVRLPGGWSFNLNPGPFNIKEHVIITIFANCGVSSGVCVGAIVIMKTYYKQSVSFLCAILVVVTTQMLGYGWAGMLRRYLVKPAEMWWPSNLAQVSLFRALHEKETRAQGLSRMKFFLICFGASFLYYFLPGYLFPLLTFFSWVCWVWPHSVTAHQIGSGYHGLGVGAFSFDWAGIASYHGSPLVTPWTSILNTAFGFVIFVYILFPLCYWKYDVFGARKFPMFSKKLFTPNGQTYDISKILTPEFELNEAAYNSHGKLHLPLFFALSVIGSGFMRTVAMFTHVLLFHGSKIWRQSKSAMNSPSEKLDVHARLMKKYKEVPHWWFLVLLVGSIGLSLVVSFVWKGVVQLPWWGLLLAFALSFLMTLPNGVIQATTNQNLGYDIIAQLLIGYIYPGRPIASLLFKIYANISTTNALNLLSDLKLGHYMKIPPRCMFVAQMAGTLIAGIVNLAVAWWMMGSIENICNADSLPAGSPWTCPKYHVTFDASVIWGLVGPARLFGPGEAYRNLLWLFLIGALLPLPVWLLTKAFPKNKWIPLINVPVITYGFARMPPASTANIGTWIVLGIVFNLVVFRYRREWWKKYNYVLSAALDAGTAFMAVFIFFTLQNTGHRLKWWGAEIDHCPLATCPTAPGVSVKGCPIVRS